MRIQFLGTGGYQPNERRHTACVLVPELGIAFDAGTSAFRLGANVTSPELRIFLSHAHLDHICGLTYLLTPIHEQRITQCSVHGLPETLEAVRRHLFSEAIFPVAPPFQMTPLAPQIEVGNGAIVTWRRQQHPGGSIGFRVSTQSGTFAYVTDTTADSDAIEFVRDVDVLIHECYFHDRDADWAVKTGHSHTSQVARLAAGANVKRLYLTHIDPRNPGDDPVGLATARAIFANTHMAEDGLVIDLKSASN